jgi:putative restriction endonuclease
MFAHLDDLLAGGPPRAVLSAEINHFSFDGRPMRLIVQSGIWKPKRLDAALTIRTTYTPPNAVPPYEDDIGIEGLPRYKYRGTDAEHSDNRALRAAMQGGLPLAYFVGVERGVYVPQYPVWVEAENRAGLEFMIAVDEQQHGLELAELAPLQRAYVTRLTKARMHQPLFRARVLRAYDGRCAICRLHHAELLDAAHIIPDGQPQGEPIVPNGLSLCKIHHAAYDTNLIGVRRDLVVEVQPRLLEEADGPMLRHGLQEISGSRLTIPRQRLAQPDPDRLEARFDQFRAAS